MTYHTIEIIGLIIEFLGKVLVAYTAIMVHHRVLEEHKIDESVLCVMKRERKAGLFGIGLMIIGFLMHVIAKSLV